MPAHRIKEKSKKKKRTLKNRKLSGGVGPDVMSKNGSSLKSNQSPLEYITEQLTTDRSHRIKTVKYKKILATEDSQFPANNNESRNVESRVKDYISTFAVPEILAILESSNFFKTYYLSVIGKMNKMNKETGELIPTFKTDNKIHQEFGEYQLMKKGQYYTEEPQIAMKKETFYDKPVDKLWNWWDDKYKHLRSLNEEGKTIIEFPLKYSGYDESILDIIKITFVNVLSKIINSYIKYGKKKENNYEKEQEKLGAFMTSLDNLFDGPSPTYNTLIDCLTYYFEYSFERSIDMDNFFNNKIKRRLTSYFNYPFFILPLSIPISYYKSCKSYVIPVAGCVITPSTGHYVNFGAIGNFMHDMGHLSWMTNTFINNIYKISDELSFPQKLDKMIEIIYTKYKIFYVKLEQLQLQLDKKLLQYMNYFVFCIMHENISYYILLYDFLVQKNVYRKSDENIVAIEQEKKIESHPINVIMAITFMMKQFDTIEKLKDLTEDYDIHLKSLKSSNITQPVALIEQPGIPFIINSSSPDPSILGTSAHPMYIPFSVYIEIIKILDSIFTANNLYDSEYLPLINK